MITQWFLIIITINPILIIKARILACRKANFSTLIPQLRWLNIGALIITSTILGVPCYNRSIVGLKTVF